VRTAFHDAVARFGGPGTRSERALSSRRVGAARATSDTPVALRSNRLLCDCSQRNVLVVEPRPTHLASRERYGATPAEGAFALCVTPSSGMGAWMNPFGFHNHSLTLAANELGTMPIARTSRGRCNTTRDQVALANSRVLATRSRVCHQTTERRIIVDRIARPDFAFVPSATPL
jgi:hypothetical protein